MHNAAVLLESLQGADVHAHMHPDLGSGVAVYGAEVHVAVFTH